MSFQTTPSVGGESVEKSFKTSTPHVDAAKPIAHVDFATVAVIAPNLHWRYSGVTSTIIALVPLQALTMPVAAIGPFLPPNVPRVRFRDIILRGWSKPPGVRCRIWHARRNDEMIIGIVLKFVLRQPWKLVFTSAAQRRHTRFTHWLMRRMDVMIATSERAARCLDIPAKVIHHGVDTTRYRPAADRGEAWRRTGLPGSFGIGAFGRIRPQKGTDLLVEAMVRLMPKYPNTTLVLTGLVTPEHAGFAADLQARVAEGGLQNRIVFLGERPSEEMAHWFRCITLYVAPMREEGFGLTPLEAMASGAAVVATKTGAAPQLVQEGETGRLIEPNDLEALVGAIEPLLADVELAESMGRRGREKALRQHDVEAEAECINAVYRDLLSPAAQ